MLCGRTDNGTIISIPLELHGSIGTYVALKMIGKGSSCIVVEVVESSSSNHYAAKVMSQRDLRMKKLLVNTNKEIDVLRRVHHRNIIEFKEVVTNGDLIYIVMELCNSGDLLKWIVDGRFDNNILEIQRVFGEICDAVSYLHKHGIAHGDLKPENIIIGSNDHIKLIDFGYSHTELMAGDQEKSGTLYYAAPELFKQGSFNTHMADIWALGVLMFAMETSLFPYNEDENIVDQILEGQILYVEDMNPQVRTFIHRLIRVNPIDRPDIDEVIEELQKITDKPGNHVHRYHDPAYHSSNAFIQTRHS